MCLSRQLHGAHLDLLSQNVVERLHDRGESLDEVPVIAHESAESMDLGIGYRHEKLLNCTYIVLAGTDPISQDMVGQLHNF